MVLDSGEVGTYVINLYVNGVGNAIMNANATFTFVLSLTDVHPNSGGIGGSIDYCI